MLLHDLKTSLQFHKVTNKNKNFLSEQLTRTSQCLFHLIPIEEKETRNGPGYKIQDSFRAGRILGETSSSKTSQLQSNLVHTLVVRSKVGATEKRA